MASRLCSFVCRLEQHLGWRAGRQASRCTDECPRLLAGKRKHVDEGLSTASEVPSLGPLHKQQIIFLSLMIRNYTNDGDGSPSFRTFDAEHTCTLAWSYLTRKFSPQDLEDVLLRTLAHAKVLLRSDRLHSCPGTKSDAGHSPESREIVAGQEIFPPRPQATGHPPAGSGGLRLPNSKKSINPAASSTAAQDHQCLFAHVNKRSNTRKLGVP